MTHQEMPFRFKHGEILSSKNSLYSNLMETGARKGQQHLEQVKPEWLPKRRGDTDLKYEALTSSHGRLQPVVR